MTRRERHGRLDRSRLPDPVALLESWGFRFHGRGRWLNMTCPWHDDSHPSLRINVETGAYRCFVCGAHGGDLISFVRAYRHLSFREACEILGAWVER